MKVAFRVITMMVFVLFLGCAANGSGGMMMSISSGSSSGGNQAACLRSCSSVHSSCTSSVGDSPTGQFKCDDNRRLCTLNCDNQKY